MKGPERLLPGIYLGTGVLALLATWAHVLGYLDAGFVGGTVEFWKDALTTGTDAHRFLVVDLFFLVFAVVVWMVVEARRIGMSWVWAYVLAGFLIGISMAVPFFLAAREVQLRRIDKPPMGRPGSTDMALLALLGVVTLAVAVYTL